MLKQRAKAVYIIIIALVVGFFVYTSQQPGSWAGFHPFHLGLDLSGGTHLVYSADTSKLASADITASMASLRDVVDRVSTLWAFPSRWSRRRLAAFWLQVHPLISSSLNFRVLPTLIKL